jgi:hypothetical protein
MFVKNVPFTLWPWKMFAVLVPLLATGAGVAVALEPGCDKQLVAPAVLGLLGSGNAYIIAVASGNLGRTMLAIPVGVTAGFLPLVILEQPVALILYVGFVAIWGLGSLIERTKSCLGCLALPFVVFMFGIVLVVSGAHASADGAQRVLAIPLCYPFECACIAACMITGTRYKGAVEGFCDSIGASVRGLIAAVVGLLPVSILARMLPGDESGAIVVGAASLVICNYFFMKNFFSAIVRDTTPAQAAPEPEAVSPDESDA